LPDWEKFADAVSAMLEAAVDDNFTEVRTYLLNNPPRKQVFIAPASIGWSDNSRRQNESEAQYLLRLVRDVRNNLFHGGKNPGSDVGYMDEQSFRDASLLRACLVILQACAPLLANGSHPYEGL
jgi:hypothetical protein